MTHITHLLTEARATLAPTKFWPAKGLVQELVAALELEHEKNKMMIEAEVTHLACLRRLTLLARELAVEDSPIEKAIDQVLAHLPEGQ